MGGERRYGGGGSFTDRGGRIGLVEDENEGRQEEDGVKGEVRCEGEGEHGRDQGTCLDTYQKYGIREKNDKE